MNRDTVLYLEGLSSFGVIFTQVHPGTKRTTRTWDQFENLHDSRGESRIDLAHEWLMRGYGVGYLLRNRLAGIDADDAFTVARVRAFEEEQGYICFPKITTPGGGIHAHFQHPPSLSLIGMKNHICHPSENGVMVPWDFKLGNRTMLMAPGTVMPKGRYEAGIWLPPPILDVRALAPDLELYREETPFLRDTRPLLDRIMRAQVYLASKAPVSGRGRGSRRALQAVAQHLVAFLDLDPSLSFYFMTTTKLGKDRAGNPVLRVAWNERFVNSEGLPAPWSDDELWRALEDAVDAPPAYGIYLFKKQQQKASARHSADEFLTALTYLPEPVKGLQISKEALYRVFCEYYSVKPEDFSKQELGLKINKAIRDGQFPFVEDDRVHEGRIYRGMDERSLRQAIEAAEQHRMKAAS